LARLSADRAFFMSGMGEVVLVVMVWGIGQQRKLRRRVDGAELSNIFILIRSVEYLNNESDNYYPS
jgi:hypothetical protein